MLMAALDVLVSVSTACAQTYLLELLNVEGGFNILAFKTGPSDCAQQRCIWRTADARRQICQRGRRKTNGIGTCGIESQSQQYGLTQMLRQHCYDGHMVRHCGSLQRSVAALLLSLSRCCKSVQHL
jgi:hypothetical protein